MHIPDGFLTPAVWASLDVLSLPAVGMVARRASQEMSESRVPLLGVMGAFVFAAQMINFPVGAGTSGHLVGSALLAVTLGPAAATLVMTAILAIQAFVFQDGGVLALGANVVNMAFFGVLAGYLPYRLLGATRRRIAIFLGGFLSVMVAALLAIAELGLSGVAMPWGALALPAGLFAVAALLEGAITVSVVAALEKMNPAWVRQPESTPGRTVRVAFAAAALALAVAGVMFASAHPDGLESLAERLGIASREQALFAAPLADYEFAAFRNSEWLRKAGAGLAGLILIYGVAAMFGRMVMARSSRSR